MSRTGNLQARGRVGWEKMDNVLNGGLTMEIICDLICGGNAHHDTLLTGAFHFYYDLVGMSAFW